MIQEFRGFLIIICENLVNHISDKMGCLPHVSWKINNLFDRCYLLSDISRVNAAVDNETHDLESLT